MAKLMEGQALSILLVTTNEQVKDDINYALSQGQISRYNLHWVSQPDLVFVRAQALLPHIILVDDDLDGTDPIPIIRKLASSVSNAVILFLVNRVDANEASQAVLVGARSFITKPFEANDLTMTIHQVLAWQRVPPVQPGNLEGAGGRIVVFCAPKGGTGRTMLATNTAIQLHQLTNEPLVLMDADFAAPALDVALNLQPERTVADLIPRLSRLDETLLESVLEEHVSGIQVMLAPPPSELEIPLTLPQVQHILVMLKRMYPWIVIDLGLPMDETAYAFLDSADLIVMTVLPEMVGLRNTRLMIDNFIEEGYPEDKIWLVVNRADIKGGVTIKNIAERLNIPVKFTVPDDQPLVTHAVNRGIPLTVSHKRSVVARSVRKMARELASELSTSSR